MEAFDWGMGSQNGKNSSGGANISPGGASHLIRSAERLAAAGRFGFAIEQLAVAQRLDPENQYIQAIMDRIRSQENPLQTESTVSMDAMSRTGKLAITVGHQFANGVRPLDGDSVLTPEDLPKRIRFLTNMADQYLESGLSEKAFDSLMRAYLLDPVSPYVIAAEKSILPAWENLQRHRGRRTSKHAGSSSNELASMLNTNATMMTNSNNVGSPFDSRPSQQVPSTQSTEEQLRMELLKQQKEQERVEKERAIWREASKGPKIFGEDDPANFSAPQPQPQEQPKPQPTGLFARLRLGKFLE